MNGNVTTRKFSENSVRNTSEGGKHNENRRKILGKSTENSRKIDGKFTKMTMVKKNKRKIKIRTRENGNGKLRNRRRIPQTGATTEHA